MPQAELHLAARAHAAEAAAAAPALAEAHAQCQGALGAAVRALCAAGLARVASAAAGAGSLHGGQGGTPVYCGSLGPGPASSPPAGGAAAAAALSGGGGGGGAGAGAEGLGGQLRALMQALGATGRALDGSRAAACGAPPPRPRTGE
jgi:hypothetical protein